MGWFFRKSFRILPGIRLNVGKRTSVSIGPPGIKYNIGSGRDRLTVGVPGTGLYHTQLLGDSAANKSTPEAAVYSAGGAKQFLWILPVLAIAGLLMLVASSTNDPAREQPTARDVNLKDLKERSAPKSVHQKSAPSYVGRAHVVDGDTINISGVLIRLEGIDAPETNQTCSGANGNQWQCGKSATQHLAVLVKGQTVSCEKTGDDAYGRTLAVCRLPDGSDLNARLVRDGFALAFVRYSSRYIKEEQEAKSAKRGLWVGSFQPPWDWRAIQRSKQQFTSNNSVALMPQATQQKSTTSTMNASCLIKGNINNRGERIYHVPGGKWYDRTQINERNGERWFCSVAEAENAGWRAPGSR